MLHYLITAVVFVAIFSLLVLIHELGHFIMAKRAGIKVEEFGFGMPPRLWGRKKGETIYSINWIPFGGFVRMLGEDSKKASMLKNERSYISKSARSRFLVIIAGVVMNFFLAWILLTVGFSVGMQPLLLPDDVFGAVSDGRIVLDEGLVVKNVEVGGFAEKVGIEVGDVIYAIDDKPVDENTIKKIEINPVGVYTIAREGLRFSLTIAGKEAPLGYDKTGFQADFYDTVSFPRMEVYDVKPESLYYLAGIRKGDVLLSVNDQQIFDTEQFEQLVRGKSKLDFELYRNSEKFTTTVSLDQSQQIVISRVIEAKPAAKIGIKAGDIVVSVNGEKFTDIGKLVEFMQLHKKETLKYLVMRGVNTITYNVVPDQNGQIGVLLSELMNYGSGQGVSLYNADVFTSIMEVKNEQFPWYVSMYKSVYEMGRLSKLTATMFVSMIGDIFSTGSVPASVSGPLGIAQMTSIMVKEGFMPVLRFIALLSLSLAVINILPLPALDGGRLLFLVVEFIIGRRVSQRLESFIHGLGYILILFLILMVTYGDVVRIFFS